MDRLICGRGPRAFRVWLLSMVAVVGMAGCGSTDETGTAPGGSGGVGGTGGTAGGGGSGGAGGTGGAPSWCGDGVVDDGEACDDGAENSDTRPGACRSDCVEPSCGDGVQDPDEGCDDGDANSDTVPGACRTSCRTASCGDGILDEGEACDGEVGVSCSDLDPDFVGGTVTCSATCVIDSSACHGAEVCGNGVDDDRDGAIDCEDTDCAADLELCPVCGDGVQSATEVCDGSDMGDGTCEGLGFELGGNLACADCQFDVTGCYVAEDCWNFVDDDGDGAIDCDDSDCSSDPIACPACGDGVVNGAEECDDGGLVDGDGCDANCNIEVNICTQAPDLLSVGTVSGPVITVSGTTVGAANDLSATCATTSGGERIYSVTLPGPADVFGKVGPPEGGAGIFSFYVRGYCLDPATDMVCTNDMVVHGDPVTSFDMLDVPGGQTIYFVIDSAAGAENAFELSVIVAPILSAGETCDRFGSENRCAPGLTCAVLSGSVPAKYVCQ